MSDPAATQQLSAPKSGVGVLIAVAAGALVAVGLGVFGKVHEPQFFSVSIAGFSWKSSWVFVGLRNGLRLDDPGGIITSRAIGNPIA